MPHIDVAMAASLHSGWLASRDIGADVQNVGHSFSSWDNCMAASYCKLVNAIPYHQSQTNSEQMACHCCDYNSRPYRSLRHLLYC